MLWIAGLYHRHAHPFHKESIFQSVIFIVFCLLGSVYFKLVGYDLTKIFRFFYTFQHLRCGNCICQEKILWQLGWHGCSTAVHTMHRKWQTENFDQVLYENSLKEITVAKKQMGCMGQHFWYPMDKHATCLRY